MNPADRPELKVNMGYIDPQMKLFYGHLGWNNNHVDFIEAPNRTFNRQVLEIHNLAQELAREDAETPDDFYPHEGSYDGDDMADDTPQPKYVLRDPTSPESGWVANPLLATVHDLNANVIEVEFGQDNVA